MQKYTHANELPKADPDLETTFHTDRNITIKNIDDNLGIEGVVYRDMRMIEDPADFSVVGGSPDLNVLIEGFEVVPLPLIANPGPMPVPTPYDGLHLFDVVWAGETKITSITPCYKESMQVLEKIFPKDKVIFAVCGGAGYSSMIRSVLIYLGWSPEKIYNVGAMWKYKGDKGIDIVVPLDNGEKEIHTDRCILHEFDFDNYTAL